MKSAGWLAGVLAITAPLCVAAQTTPADHARWAVTDYAREVLLNQIKQVLASKHREDDLVSERAQAKAAGNDEAELDDWEKLDAQKEKTSELFNDLIGLVESAYGVGPRETDGQVQPPHDLAGRGAWSAGLAMKWDPQLLDDHNKIESIVSRSDGRTHYVGGFPLSAFDHTMGVTYADGQVLMNSSRLQEALNANNPGLLALTLRHEAQHFDDLRTHGFDSKESDEYRAYSTDIAEADYFGLNTNQIKELREYRDANKTAMDAGRLTSFFPAPNEESALKDRKPMSFMTAPTVLCTIST